MACWITERSYTIVTIAKTPSQRERWTKFCEQERERILRFISCSVGNIHDAEDLTQTTMIKAYLALPEGSETRGWSPWLFRVATNVMRDRYRKKRPELVWDEEPQPLERCRPVEDWVLQEMDWERLVADCRDLPPRQRIAVYLFYFEEQSVVEISVVLETSVAAVWGLLYRALRALRIVCSVEDYR
jgi:RNA polymerase sigma-70 factor (ECF subfamily)